MTHLKFDEKTGKEVISEIILLQGRQTFPQKSSGVSILGVAGHIVAAAKATIST